MEDDYNHVSEELVYCLTNVPGPGLVGGIPADLGGCLCTVRAFISTSHHFPPFSSPFPPLFPPRPPAVLAAPISSPLPIILLTGCWSKGQAPTCQYTSATQRFQFYTTDGQWPIVKHYYFLWLSCFQCSCEPSRCTNRVAQLGPLPYLK